MAAPKRDWGDCFTPKQWYEFFPDQGDRYIAIDVTENIISETYIGKSNYNKEEEIKTYSFYLRMQYVDSEIYLRQGGSSASGIIYADKRTSNDHAYSLVRMRYTRESMTKKCTSTAYGKTEPDIILTNDPTPFRDTGEYLFGGEFTPSYEGGRLASIGGKVVYVARVIDYEETPLLTDHTTGTGTGSTPKKTYKYEVYVTFYQQIEVTDPIAPKLIEFLIPTKNAWDYANAEHTDFIVPYDHNKLPMTLSENYDYHNSASWYMDSNAGLDMFLLPKGIKWIRPYPKGKWYDDGYGLTTRGLPKPLIDDQGAFNKCKYLTDVTIPESVKSIGAWTFWETQLKSVTIASDCTYSARSFPVKCKINFYGGGVPVITTILDMEQNLVGRLCTMSINELEGN